MDKKIKSTTYHVKGMHCASCEIVIEKKLLKISNVKSAEASTTKGRVVIAYKGSKPTLKKLNQIFKQQGYSFSQQPPRIEKINSKQFLNSLGIGLLIIIAFLGLNRLGLSSLVSVGTTSSLPIFFLLGLIAGLSSCAALVGGLILSMSKQWGQLYTVNDSVWEKIQPHLSFNVGRLISYAILGMALGALGSKLSFSLTLGSFLVVVVSAFMIVLGLQMLGVKALKRFQLTVPKSLTKYIADETNFKNRFMPSVMGALTFFLPCGFTLTAQGLALISGSAIQGGLMMLLFALGTAPSLLFIGLSSVRFAQKPHLADKFAKVAGVLVLFFAIYNINFQLNVLGVTSLSDIGRSTNQLFNQEKNQPTQVEKGLAPIVNGKQVLKMEAGSYSYAPNYFKIKAGIPVRWEVVDEGISGCTNAIISRNLFTGEFPLKTGEMNVKEFIPENPGTYKFSCWMGMISGIIEVIN